jgi:hypothetical protein
VISPTPGMFRELSSSVQALPGGTGSGEVPNFYFLFLLPVPDENAVAQRFAVLVLRRLTQRRLLLLSVLASKGWRPDPGAERMLESQSFMLTAPGAERMLEFQTFMLTFGSTSRALVRRLCADAVFSLTEPLLAVPSGCWRLTSSGFGDDASSGCVACSCKVALRRRPQPMFAAALCSTQMLGCPLAPGLETSCH